MKIKKDSINLVNKKKNALSTTAQLLHLKSTKLKITKNDFQNPKKVPIVKQKLNLTLNELSTGLKEGPKKMNKKPKATEFNLGQSKLTVKATKVNNQSTTPTNLEGCAGKSTQSAKRAVKRSASKSKQTKETNSIKTNEDTIVKSKSPVNNNSSSTNKEKKHSSQQLNRSMNTGNMLKQKGWHKSSKKKKVPKPIDRCLNPVGEARLDINKVTTAVTGLFKILESKSQSTDLLDQEEPIFMEVECIKIPQCPTKQLRFKLPHSLMNEMSDILLITTDLKGHKIDPEKAVDHYNELLKKHNITFIQKVMPLRMLRQECSQYEVKRKLVDQFDMILVEASAAKSMPKLLGKFVMFGRKMPIGVHLDRKDLKSHLELSVRKTQMTVKSTGHLSTVQVGHTKMSSSEIAANIVEISKTLPFVYPGGWNNIRSLHIKTAHCNPLIIYVSYMSPNMVKLKTEQSKKRKAIEDELSTYPGKIVVVQPDGNVFLKTGKNDKDPVDNSQDDEILKEAEDYIQSSRTVRFDDGSDDDNDKDADAITNSVENEFLSQYKKAMKSAQQGGNQEEDEESSDEEEPVLPPIGKNLKLESTKNRSKKNALGKKLKQTGKKLKETKQQHNFKGKQNEGTDGIKKRGTRGGKRNKVNKDQRKALIKRKKAGTK